MDLADERLHAAAKSGDVEQLQVTWSYRAVRPMLDQATGLAFGAAVVGNGGRAHAPRRVRHFTRPDQPFEHALRALLPLRSTGTRHTHWLVSASNPALGVFYQRNNPRHMQRLDAFSGKGGRRSRWRQWPVIRQWSRF